MSTIDLERNHTVVSYISGTTVALTGQRLSVCNYRTDKVTGVKRASVAVSVPVVTSEEVVDSIEKLLPHVINMLAKVQDDIIRDRVTVSEGAPSVAHILDSEINIAACIAWLESTVTDSNGVSVRLTKASIEQWFDVTLAEPLYTAVSIKVQEDSKVKNMVSEYRKKFAALAGGATKYSIDISKALQKALDIVRADIDSTDTVFTKIDSKLNEFIKPVNADELLLCAL